MAREKTQSQAAQTQFPTENLPLEEQVRRRAHEIWLQRGGQDGSDIGDWLQAKEEICLEQVRTAARLTVASG
jgi:hypothetical protein